jgi:hypothetical protein
MLFKNGGTLFQLSGRKQLIQLAVHGDKALRIVMPAIDEDHAHPQFANDFLVETFEPFVVMKTNKKTVELEVEVDGAHPIFGVDTGLVVLNGQAQLVQQFRIGLSGTKNSGNFQHAAQVVDLLHVAQGELRYDHTAMQVAMEETFEGENAKSLAHGIAGNAERSGKRKLLQGSAWAKLTIENTLAQDGSHLVRDADAVNLGALHAVVPWGRRTGDILCRQWSLCQVVKS